MNDFALRRAQILLQQEQLTLGFLRSCLFRLEKAGEATSPAELDEAVYRVKLQKLQVRLARLVVELLEQPAAEKEALQSARRTGYDVDACHFCGKFMTVSRGNVWFCDSCHESGIIVPEKKVRQ